MASKLGDGKVTVATAGTAVKLTNDGTYTTPTGPIESVIVTNQSGGTLWVGGSTVSASGTRGTPLSTGQAVGIDTDDLADVWVDATVNGTVAVFTYTAR
jgi:hypothetical protein